MFGRGSVHGLIEDSAANEMEEGLRVIAIMDKPSKRSNVRDVLETSLAVIERLESKSDCLYLSSSHAGVSGQHLVCAYSPRGVLDQLDS